jgi:hypothetical protein
MLFCFSLVKIVFIRIVIAYINAFSTHELGVRVWAAAVSECQTQPTCLRQKSISVAQLKTALDALVFTADWQTTMRQASTLKRRIKGF